MNRYGQSVTWGPLNAPAIFAGEAQSYSLRDAVTKQNIDGAAGDWIAMALHSHKAELNFEAKVTSNSTNFLDLSTGAAISVSTISTGIVLATRAVERWRLNQPKTASVQGNWYPDMTQASPVMAGTGNTAFTPSQSGLSIVTPGSTIIYSTYGLTHADGIVHELTLTQQLAITDDEPSPDGLLLGAASHGYERTINMMLLAPYTASPGTSGMPAVESTLVIGGGTTAMANYLVTSAELAMEMEKGMMYSLEAAWIPPFGT